ncbi:MAG: hypothetical protein ACI9Q4_001603 [Sediminicola sp.]|jgi:hypothetical protein
MFWSQFAKIGVWCKTKCYKTDKIKQFRLGVNGNITLFLRLKSLINLS